MLETTNKQTELWTDFPATQLVRTNRVVKMIGRVTFLVLILSLFAALFVPWRQTAKGSGYAMALDPQERPQPVLSPAEGIVSDVTPGIREGSYVEKGQPVLRIEPFASDAVLNFDAQISFMQGKRDSQDSAVKFAEQDLRVLESQRENIFRQVTSEVESALKKWEQAKNKVTQLNAEWEDKLNQFSTDRRVADVGLVPNVEIFSKQRAVEQAFAKLTEQENAVQQAYADLAAKEEEAEAKKEEINSKIVQGKLKIQTEIGKLNTIDKDLTLLRNKRQEFDRLDVTATHSGFIQEWKGFEGSATVKKGSELFTIVPRVSEMAIELQVNGNDNPLIAEGDPVRLQFEGWPAVQMVGWPSVAVGTFGGKVNRVFPAGDGNGMFRVIITEDKHFEGDIDWPNDRKLRQGARADGWVLLREVPLGFEIWRQLNGFPQALSDEKEQSKEKIPKVKIPKI